MPANRSSNCGIYHGNYKRIRSFQSCSLRNCRYFIVSIFYAVDVRLFQKKVLQRLNFISRAGLFLLCDHVASVILSLGDSTYWTGSLTCSTIDAGISINNICIFAFRNCTYRTFSFASTHFTHSSLITRAMGMYPPFLISKRTTSVSLSTF